MPRASVGKWLQLVGAMRWLVLSQVGSLFGKVFPHAIQGVSFQSREEGVESTVEGEAATGIEKILIDVSWSAVAGSRASQSKRDVVDPYWTLKAIILSVLLEPVAALHHHFIDVSLADLYASSFRYPPVLDLLDPGKSMVEASLQYWSSIIVDPANIDRLSLAITFRRCIGFSEWAAQFPEDLSLLRKGALSLIAAGERRLSKYMQDELGCFGICDMRRPEDCVLRGLVTFVK